MREVLERQKSILFQPKWNPSLRRSKSRRKQLKTKRNLSLPNLKQRRKSLKRMKTKLRKTEISPRKRKSSRSPNPLSQHSNFIPNLLNPRSKAQAQFPSHQRRKRLSGLP
jgi:SOS response regulatory protein OraA/RecX